MIRALFANCHDGDCHNFLINYMQGLLPRGTTKVAQASRKITERRLKWYGHVMTMEEDHVVKRVMTKAIPGKRKRGRPKTRWKDVCKRDMQTVGLREGDAGDRAYWKEMINNHSGDPR